MLPLLRSFRRLAPTFRLLFPVLFLLGASHPHETFAANSGRTAPDAPARTVKFRSLRQPTFTSCGQTSVAMIAGVDVKTVINTVGTGGGTSAEQLVAALRLLRPETAPKIVQLNGRNPSSDGIVSLVDPASGGRHWTVYHDGKYYDPIFGKVGDYPSWMRKQLAIAVN